jgi:hypothetical protein
MTHVVVFYWIRQNGEKNELNVTKNSENSGHVLKSKKALFEEPFE